MKKYFLFISLLFVSLFVLAQDRKSDAYENGYAMGKIVGIVLIAGFVIWGIAKLVRKK